MNSKRNTLRHVVTNMMKIKETTLKAARAKQQITYRRTSIRLSAGFSAETLQTRKKWHDKFKVMKGRKTTTKKTQQDSPSDVMER